MTEYLSGKAAIVTGAAGGIGSAIVRRFVDDGATVLATDRSNDALQAAYPDVDRVILVPVDLTQATAALDLLEQAASRFGRLDVLVNNAGVGAARSALETTDEEWDRYLDVNLRSVFRLSRESLHQLRISRGCILNIASVFGMVGFRGSAPYSASKAGVIGLTRQMAADCGPLNVRVNAISPGVIDTAMTRGRLAEGGWHVRATVEATPLGRPGRPVEIASVASFLCSDDASYITDEIIAVDGGWASTRYLA